MSRFENELAKPILEPLIRSGEQARILSLDDQAAIVAWAMKTTLVFDFTTVKTAQRHYSQEQRSEFAANFIPPPDSFIWIANYLGKHRTYSSITNLWLTDRDDQSVRYRAQAATFAAGRIAFQVLNVSASEHAVAFEEGDAIDPDWQRAAFRLWPSDDRPLQWPPTAYFDDIALVGFAARVGNEMPVR